MIGVTNRHFETLGVIDCPCAWVKRVAMIGRRSIKSGIEQLREIAPYVKRYPSVRGRLEGINIFLAGRDVLILTADCFIFGGQRYINYLNMIRVH